MLELKGATAGYDGHIVVRDVDLCVPDGSVVALLGPNGAGKTTLLRAAAGLIPLTEGSIRLDDRDVTSWPSHRRAQAGLCLVPEGRGIFPALTVADNLRLQAPPAVDRAASAEAVRSFPRLGERLRQRAGTMSGGEQQMLALARAYVAAPRVVLLDEVSMGLAPKIVDEIFGYLRGLVDRGVTLLLVEQYVTRALELADYVYVLNKGRVSFAGEPGQVDEASVTESYLGA